MKATETDFTIETTPTSRIRLHSADIKAVLDAFDSVLRYASKRDRESMQIAGEKFFALLTHHVSNRDVACIKTQSQQFASQFNGEPDTVASTITFHISEPDRLSIQFDDRVLVDTEYTPLDGEYAQSRFRRMRERLYNGIDRHENGLPGFSMTVSIVNLPEDGLHLASQQVGGATPNSWLQKVLYSWLRKKEWSNY